MSAWGANMDFNNAVVNLFTYETQEFKGNVHLNLEKKLQASPQSIKHYRLNIDLIFKFIHKIRYGDRFSSKCIKR